MQFVQLQTSFMTEKGIFYNICYIGYCNIFLCSVIKQTVTQGVRVLGGVSLQMPLPSVLSTLAEFLHSYGMELPQGQLMALYRVEVRGVVFYSRCYERVKKRNSYTVVYCNKSNSRKFAFIEYFLYIGKKVIAILRELLPVHGSCKDHFDLSTSVVDTVSFLRPVSVADRFDVCFVEDILNKCLFIDFNDMAYVALFPSSLAFD